MKYKLGMTYVDILTGFAGVATGFCTYITGCDRLLIQPASKADDLGVLKVPEWIDVGRLKLLDNPQVNLPESDSVGGDVDPPRK